MSGQLSCWIYPHLPSPPLHNERGPQYRNSATSFQLSLPCFVGAVMRHIQEDRRTELDSSLLASEQEGAFHLCVTVIQ